MSTRIKQRIKRVVADRVKYTGKSKRWVLSTLIASGDYQRLLDGELLKMYFPTEYNYQ